MTGKEMAQALTNFVNRANDEDIAEFAATLAYREHRTLQQQVMAAFLSYVANVDELAVHGRYDLRNEATAEIATMISESILPNYTKALITMREVRGIGEVPLIKLPYV
jgi:GTP cyclohydrolase III